MSELSTLAAAARRGTDRAALPEPGASPLGAALARVTRDTPEATLLARAALAGLHAEAGHPPATPTAPAPRFTAGGTAARYASPAFTALIPSLAELPGVAREALVLLHSSGLHLTAMGALPLLPAEERGEPLPLWPVLDEHARWLVGLNPDWKRHNPDLAPPALRLARRRREWTDTHAGDPARTVQTLLSAWPTLKADERRAALDAIAPSLTPDDRPLLDLALTDRVEDIRSRAARLGANLPGPLADEVRATLRAQLQVGKNGKLKVVGGELPAALGKLERYETAPVVLLGSLSIETAARMLDLAPSALVELLGGQKDWALRSAPATSAGQNGASLDVLYALTSQGQRVDVSGWPTPRRRALLNEAVSRLLGAPVVDTALADIAAMLLGAGTDLSGAQAGALLARLLDNLQRHLAHALPDVVAGLLTAEKNPDKSKREALIAHLLGNTHRTADWARPPHLDLLAGLAPHLDPDAPLPPLPDLPFASGQEALGAEGRERLTENREAFSNAASAAHAGLAHALDLRRRVRRALQETP